VSPTRSSFFSVSPIYMLIPTKFLLSLKDAARLSMAKWYNKVEEAGFHSFNVIAATFHEHYNEILNFYNNRSSNAMAESFNAKIKLFRANLRGVVDKKFFLFRIANLYAYPH